MSQEAIEPLRINKNTPSSSPSKMDTTGSENGPLSEISPMERRRNSPSYNQLTKRALGSTSPLDTSPFGNTGSKHRFWQARDPNSPRLEDSENVPESERVLSPKRSSIENLMKASRVKNSSMFAREKKSDYDPTSLPIVERPLAVGRPFRGVEGLRSSTGSVRGHQRGNSESAIPTSPSMSPTKPPSPSKSQASPIKSSLNKNGRYSQGGYYDESSALSSDDERVGDAPARPLRRHAKSVTFDAKPPVINEYEMVTPDPSLASREGSYDSEEEDDEYEFGYDPDDSVDRDSFDASLEDTAKTPVVLPDEWRHMGHQAAETSFGETYDDPFNDDASPAPTARPSSRRSNSEPEVRPLPPLPPSQQSPRGRRESNSGLAAAAERASSVRRRSLPSPPGAATISKSDLLNMCNNAMSLEDRLGLMGLSTSREGTPTATDKHDSARESDEGKEGTAINEEAENHEDPADESDASNLDEINIPHISRESILEKVKGRNFENYNFNTEQEDDSVDVEEYDPDVPIPSREASSQFDFEVADGPVKTEHEEESELDLQSVPEFQSAEGSPAPDAEYERESSIIRHDISRSDVEEDDDASHYSTPHSEHEESKVQSTSTDEDDGPPTPKAGEVIASSEGEIVPKKEHQKVSSLPEFGSFLNEDDFHLQLQSYLGKNRATPTPGDSEPKSEADTESLDRPVTPQESTKEDEEEEDPGTPDSVIRHPIAPEERASSEEVEEPVATIKAPGGMLKTRTSNTPADFHTMAATRRHVSGERPPPMFNHHNDSEESFEEEPSHLSHVSEEPSIEEAEEEEERSKSDSEVPTSQPKRRQSFKMKIDLPVGDIGEDLSFDLDKEFDNIVEQQKKGYVMRQNTKVVVASNRKFSDEVDPTEGSSTNAPVTATERGLVPPPGRGNRTPSKGTRDRSHTWTTEPWNGKTRRSVRNASSGQHDPSRTKAASGPAPPLPGQDSNVSAGFAGDMSMIDEDNENTERGRLFVKVVGVKDLDLPLPKNERTSFQLTLDNGLHCVTTAWLELGRSAPIGQEFELVVLNDLEFQLTLQTKLQPPPKPKATPAPVSVPFKPSHKKTNSAFGRLLQTSKKRKELERKQQEEAERAAALKAQQEREAAAAKRASANPTAWDLLHDLVAADGSFARAYVCLKNHERQAFGRPYTVDIPCFNEWAVESDPSIASSVKSKRGGVVRKPPYKVGKLTLQLLYVPKPKGAKDDDLPKSMNACIREMKEAEDLKSRVWEGYLSQQGGDCPYWRRRFFRLSGTKLTAYHETTRQPRATINLAKAAKVVDDKSTLVQSSPSKNGNRRKSGFAEEDEGYAFVEEGFRIRFHNGETIDFYADNAEDKEGWIKVLSETVGKDAPSASAKAWTELVFQKEKAERNSGRIPSYHRQQAQFQALAQQVKQQEKVQPPLPTAFDPTRPTAYDPTRPGMYDRATTRSAPGSPDKRKSEIAPAPIDKSPRHHTAPRPRAYARRGDIKSMIF